MEALQATIDRINRASIEDPDLKGRVEVVAVFHPGDPGALADFIVQAFVHTDVVSAGSLALGQNIELQHYLQS